MKLDKKEIGFRLKSWLKEKYGSVKAGAEHLGRTADSIQNSYLNGKSIPGGELIARLLEEGCDIKWLFFGANKENLKKAEVSGMIRLNPQSLPGKIIFIDGENNKFLLDSSEINENISSDDLIIIIKPKRQQGSSSES